MANKKLKKSIIISEVDDGYVAIDSNINKENSECLVKLNDTSKTILELLKDGLEMDEIASNIIDEYDVSEDRVNLDISDIVEKLESIGFLED